MYINDLGFDLNALQASKAKNVVSPGTDNETPRNPACDVTRGRV